MTMRFQGPLNVYALKMMNPTRLAQLGSMWLRVAHLKLGGEIFGLRISLCSVVVRYISMYAYCF